MKKIFLCCLFLLATLSRAQVTIRPFAREVGDPDVRMTRIELTSKYTIIDFVIVKQQSAFRMSPDGRGFSLGDGTSEVCFRPDARLREIGGRQRSYKYIKVEGVPEDPKKYQMRGGEKIEFTVWFERMDAGVEAFDLIECKNSQGYVCFNFFGVECKNPLKSKPSPPRKPAADVPIPIEVLVRGTVFDAKTKKVINAFIRYSTPTDSVAVQSTSGQYEVKLVAKKKYNLVATVKGYFAKVDSLNVRIAGQTLTRDIYLEPLETGAKVTLNNVYFDVSLAVLRPESYPELDKLVALMQENPRTKIKVEGHTDVVGDYDANLELSKNRVQSVKEYLVSKGIDGSRVEVTGYGSSRPLNKNGTQAERQKNRRVEFTITEV